MLSNEPREREDFCFECDAIITQLVMEEVDFDTVEIPFGLYEDWEWEEKEDEEEED
jgi:hypothetical protein